MTDKLKPCPFCGGKEVYLAKNCYGQNYVRCPNCGAVVWGDDDENLTEKRAIELWNRRADNDHRDRLIELFQEMDRNPELTCPNIKTDESCKGCKYELSGFRCNQIARKVDYLLANGVIVPPVEAGQTVWYVDDFTEEIEECKVYGFNVVNGKVSLCVDNGECKWITRKWHNTKEEALAKLKELKENATQKL